VNIYLDSSFEQGLSVCMKMKVKNQSQQKKNSKRPLRRTINGKKLYEPKYYSLCDLPFVVLCHLSSFLTGFDALAFGQCVSSEIMASERKFWRSLGV